jgi:hypothetical protein
MSDFFHLTILEDAGGANGEMTRAERVQHITEYFYDCLVDTGVAFKETQCKSVSCLAASFLIDEHDWLEGFLAEACLNPNPLPDNPLEASSPR